VRAADSTIPAREEYSFDSAWQSVSIEQTPLTLLFAYPRNLVRKESSRQTRERIATELADMKTNGSEWTQIGPLLDEAMEALPEADRSAILLRYFENRSLREVGQTLGLSEDAAQKRVSRAVERLREFFSKQGLTIGAGGLAALLSANAVQSSPVGLSATIPAAAALSGAGIQDATTLGAAKIIAMTTIQKTLIAAALAAAVGTGIYEAHRISTGPSAKVSLLKKTLEKWPHLKIPELQFATEKDWRLAASLRDSLKTYEDCRYPLSELRRFLEDRFAGMAKEALTKYMQANNGQFPTDLSQLQPYFKSPMDDAILRRYEIVPAKPFSDPPLEMVVGDWIIVSKAPVDQMDSRVGITPGGYGHAFSFHSPPANPTKTNQ